MGCLISLHSVARIPATGLWVPPKHNGHGIDLQKAGPNYVVLFYTYDDQQQPIWYLGVASWQANAEILVGGLDEYRYEHGAAEPTQRVGQVGEFTLTFDQPDPACEGVDAAHHATFNWQLGAQQGSWCLVSTLAQSDVRQVDFTGQYFSGSEDSGWGYSLDYQGTGPERTVAALVYYYGLDGSPLWALGSGASRNGQSTLDMNHVIGYCRTCPPVALSFTPIGHVTLQLNLQHNQRVGLNQIELRHYQSEAQVWQRTDAPLIPLSEPEPGMNPLPAQLGAEQSTAVVDVKLVPMTTGLPVLEHQNVVFEQGQIIDINQDPSFASRFTGTQIEGRGLYLAPGLSEMHLHINTGGLQAAEQAGLLLIANGVTTALNTGNDFAIDVPQLGERFEQGELIGPTLYAGQVAYGVADNSNPSLTVSSPAEATAYAERLDLEAYDFIKFYWQLTGPTITQFFLESERLSLPVIGHIPQTQAMFRSLFQGQKLAVHIQEPHVTHLNFQRDDSRLPEVAEIFLEHGTYMSPTLAVFESYVNISGNETEAYQALITREGHQFTPQAVKNIWRNYFNQPFIQNGDQEDLQDLMAFYMRMTWVLFEAGVPLLSGTDATGFPGVMAGYGVHEELRLLHEAGIPVPEVLAISTRNAGQFIQQTLPNETPFGTIETGHRADFILTEANPLDSLETLKTPSGVMARGRFWSQDHLQSLLLSLDLKQASTEPAHNKALPHCNHQHIH
ncbi:amidohydrolase family protein [Marinicella meishanensis]|uniref:amidohydrolase family protein n=1 Tax=Marinicella meishanensis TaxID=2873263 RepID=UPI001CBE5CD9|nr:amidohydrolase family protein [Marinicella sp. NBU2979]